MKNEILKVYELISIQYTVTQLSVIDYEGKVQNKVAVLGFKNWGGGG